MLFFLLFFLIMEDQNCYNCKTYRAVL